MLVPSAHGKGKQVIEINIFNLSKGDKYCGVNSKMGRESDWRDWLLFRIIHLGHVNLNTLLFYYSMNKVS